MNAAIFSTVMENFKARFIAVEKKLDQIYKVLGIDMIEVLEYISFETTLVETIALAINAEKANEIMDELLYLIYDCNFDFSTYADNVTFEIEGEEKHPIISNWEDFYNFITDEE